MYSCTRGVCLRARVYLIIASRQWDDCVDPFTISRRRYAAAQQIVRFPEAVGCLRVLHVYGEIGACVRNTGDIHTLHNFKSTPSNGMNRRKYRYRCLLNDNGSLSSVYRRFSSKLLLRVDGKPMSANTPSANSDW
jgi:hypothetical protein